MKHYVPLFLFLLTFPFLWSQTENRELINGQINAANGDIEGISIFNTSTNKGTITNSKGVFAIEAGLNDELEISALQFKKKTIIVGKEILENKSLKIALVESINALDEVVILPHQLLGDIEQDIEASEIYEPLTFSFDSFDDYEFSADNKTKVENLTVNNGGLNHGLNLVNVFKVLVKPLFKKNKSKSNNNSGPPRSLSNIYTSDFLAKGFNIPNDEAALFIEYVESNGLTNEMLQDGNEMKLIALLHEKSKDYLKVRDED